MCSFSCPGLTRQKSRCQQSGLLSDSSKGEEGEGGNHFQVCSGWWQSSFLMAVGLRFPVPCWLSARGFCQRLRAFYFPVPVLLPTVYGVSLIHCTSQPPFLPHLTEYPFLPSGGKNVALQSACDYIGPNIQYNLSVLKSTN